MSFIHRSMFHSYNIYIILFSTMLSQSKKRTNIFPIAVASTFPLSIFPWHALTRGVKQDGDGGDSLGPYLLRDDFLNPSLYLSYIGVQAVFVWLCAWLTPTDYASQSPSAALHWTCQRSSRVEMTSINSTLLKSSTYKAIVDGTIIWSRIKIIFCELKRSWFLSDFLC